jgi:selenocysteine lyase/cysteine desulfurase
MKRRHFFKSIGGLASGLFFTGGMPVFSSLSSFRSACRNTPIDEKFWKLVRKQFLLPENYAYLNTGGLGTSPALVRVAVKKRMDQEDAHPSAGYSEKDWWKIKEECAPLLGPDVKKEELAFTSTATEGINIIINGLPLNRGDEIITSTHEHPALNVPLLYRMKTKGIVIKTFEPDLVNAPGNVQRIERLITKRTRLIFISHITCITGQIMPVEEIGQLARAKGLWFALDGVQAVGHLPMNIGEIGVDFYAVSGHKWLLGPRRTGIFYIKKDLLDANIVKPCVVGAYSNGGYDMPKRQLKLHPTAQRFEYATQNEALFYGLEAAVDFIYSIGIENIRDHNKHLSEMFYIGLSEMSHVELLSPLQEKNRSSMIAFRIKNKDNRKITIQLEKKGFRLRQLVELNPQAIRASFHVYNNEQEVQRLLQEIKSLKM